MTTNANPPPLPSKKITKEMAIAALDVWFGYSDSGKVSGEYRFDYICKMKDALQAALAAAENGGGE